MRTRRFPALLFLCVLPGLIFVDVARSPAQTDTFIAGSGRGEGPPCPGTRVDVDRPAAQCLDCSPGVGKRNYLEA